jgi:hypothetical protein
MNFSIKPVLFYARSQTKSRIFMAVACQLQALSIKGSVLTGAMKRGFRYRGTQSKQAFGKLQKGNERFSCVYDE